MRQLEMKLFVNFARRLFLYLQGSGKPIALTSLGDVQGLG